MPSSDPIYYSLGFKASIGFAFDIDRYESIHGPVPKQFCDCEGHGCEFCEDEEIGDPNPCPRYVKIDTSGGSAIIMGYGIAILSTKKPLSEVNALLNEIIARARPYAKTDINFKSDPLNVHSMMYKANLGFLVDVSTWKRNIGQNDTGPGVCIKKHKCNILVFSNGAVVFIIKGTDSSFIPFEWQHVQQMANCYKV